MGRLAWQRYPYHGTPWAATMAVDGRRSDLSAPGGQCAISANGHSEAEWRVDLGGVRNLHHIVIQHRTDNVAWGIYQLAMGKYRVLYCKLFFWIYLCSTYLFVQFECMRYSVKLCHLAI